jgi:hypothetical protein
MWEDKARRREKDVSSQRQGVHSGKGMFCCLLSFIPRQARGRTRQKRERCEEKQERRKTKAPREWRLVFGEHARFVIG